MRNFAHLHLHTEYSLLDGSIRVEELMCRAKEFGMSSVAITDHGSMFGVVEFYKQAVKNGIKPILGCEVYVSPNAMGEKGKSDKRYYHLILLAENDIGYHNLMKIVSLGYIDGFYYKPRVDYEVLRKYASGIIATSACLGGEIPDRLMQHDYTGALEACKKYIGIFGKNNFFLELQDHGLMEQKLVNKGLIRLSQETGLDLIATNDAHYLKREDAKIHDVLLCIQTGKTVDDENRMKFPADEFYFKSGDEMYEVFSYVPEVLENTLKIAERCNVDLDFGHFHLPRYDVPDGHTNNSYLRELVYAGLKKRYAADDDEALKRAEFELSTIEEMGYVDYFLIVWDFINFAKNKSIEVGPGRGSAPGSIVAYSLGITDVDPLKFDLLFERFLNPERVTMPDIDIDFCYERREEVIDYVIRKYGSDRVAQIITFGTMAARAAIRDVGRALDMPYNKVDRVAKMVPQELNMTLGRAIEISPDLKKAMDADEEVNRLIEYSKSVEGQLRHSSTHAAGVLITKEPVTEFVPLARNGEIITTQFNMVELEELGLLKMDFLGLRTLTVIRDAVDNIKREHGIEIDWADISLDDRNIYDMFKNAETLGVFQFESSGMRAFLKDLKPNVFDDLVAANALFRPGPMNQIPEFIRNKRDSSQIKYIHPKLEKILKVTYGCVVYQEQVMQIVRDIAGYSIGRADLVRRAMAKKKKSVMEEERKNFIYGSDKDGIVEVPGAVRRGIDENSASKIYDLMIDFANYAFNKSHSVAYALLAYRTAYLKYYYPVEFMAAQISSLMNNVKQVSMYINECKRLGIEVLPPHINFSYGKFAVDDGKIRFGLSAVKGVGSNLIKAAVTERDKGKFKSFRDFIERINSSSPGVINKKAIENLIRCGAFDGMEGNRAQLVGVYSNIIDSVMSEAKKNVDGQFSLFDMDKTGDMFDKKEEDKLPKLSEFSHEKILEMEKELLGIYVSGNPLDGYEKLIKSLCEYDIAEIVEGSLDNANKKFYDGKHLTLGGVVKTKRELFTKNNKLMAFVTVEDTVGEIEAVVFPEVYERARDFLNEDAKILISGKLSMSEVEEPKILASKIMRLEKNTELNPDAKLYTKLYSYDKILINEILKVCKKYSGDVPVYIYISDEEKNLEVSRKNWVNRDCLNILSQELKTMLGDRNVMVV